MRIGIDISTLLNHGHDIGAGRYIYNLLKGLFEIDRSENIFVLTGRYTTDDYLSVISNLIANYPDTKIKLEFYKTTPEKLNLWNKLKFPPIELLGFKAELLHCPDFLIPPTLNRNIVLTIHDLSFIRFPQFNFDWFIRKYTKEVRNNAKRAKKIIAVSNSTRNDIISFLNIVPEKITVTYEAVDDVFRKLDENEIKKEILDNYNIKGKYILSVGTIEPRKNFPTLIKAFNLLKENIKTTTTIENKNIIGNKKKVDTQLHSTTCKYPNNSTYTLENLKLVIAGRTGWKSEATYEEKERSPYKEDILFIGRVSDKELCQLYNQAEVFVYPSIFEGFGLPPLEAMSCGLPVIASDCSSLKEIVEDAGILVPPEDFKALSENILKILKDENLRKKLKEKSIAQAKKFSWEKAAIETLNTYRNIYNINIYKNNM